MEKQEKYSHTNPKAIRLAGEIFSLALEINTETKFAVFCDFHGHVNQLEVRIKQDKENANRDAADKFEIYLTPYSKPEDDDYEEDVEKIITRLEKVKANMEAILKKHSLINPHLVLEDKDEDEELAF